MGTSVDVMALAIQSIVARSQNFGGWSWSLR